MSDELAEQCRARIAELLSETDILRDNLATLRKRLTAECMQHRATLEQLALAEDRLQSHGLSVIGRTPYLPYVDTDKPYCDA
jgi:prefoldin subunit 5